MNIRQPGIHQLNTEMIEETINDLRNLGISTQNEIEIGLAQVIIINTLGGEFWAKECTSFGVKQNFFQTKNNAKIVHLAGMLWNFKDCDGYENFLRKNDQNDFESTYYECLAAHWFLKESRDIAFVVPKNQRGTDFDLKVTDFNGYDHLNVEVKARREYFQSEKNARNFLSKLRSQLPSGQPGAVVCKIKPENEGITQDQLIEVTASFIKGTGRIDFVVYCWDDSHIENALMYKYFSVNEKGLKEKLFYKNMPYQFSLLEIVKSKK